MMWTTIALIVLGVIVVLLAVALICALIVLDMAASVFGALLEGFFKRF
jgi:hypothetical protein